MKYGIYSIRDSAADVFTAPTIDLNDDSAIRSFAQAVNHPDSLMNFSPSDFSLYRIGSFDVDDGSIEPLNPSSKLVCADRLVKAVIDNEG